MGHLAQTPRIHAVFPAPDPAPLLRRGRRGYLHTYHDPTGKHTGKPWVGKIKLAAGVVRLGRFRGEREAAAAVAGWYAARFGADWPAWVGRLHPGRSVAGAAWLVKSDPARGGWRLWVWDEGVKMEIFHRRPGSVYPTRAAAAARFLRHRHRLGLLADVILRRLPGSPPPGDDTGTTPGGAKWRHS